MRREYPYITPWKPYFAWLPVTLPMPNGAGKVTVWLEWLQRRRCGVWYEFKELPHA